MSKQLLLVGAVTVLAGSAALASTQTFTAFNDYDQGFLNPGYYLNSAGFLGPKSLSDVFDLTQDGFVPGVDDAFSGTAYFDITDFVDLGNRERINIDLGSLDVVPNGQVHDYAFSFNTAGGASDLSILADINADGELDYTITATTGDFFVSDADLTVRATVPSRRDGGDNGQGSVPDAGSTMGLLGFGLAGLTGISRKFSGAK